MKSARKSENAVYLLNQIKITMIRPVEKLKALQLNPDELAKCYADPLYFYNTYIEPDSRATQDELEHWTKYGNILNKRKGQPEREFNPDIFREMYPINKVELNEYEELVQNPDEDIEKIFLIERLFLYPYENTACLAKQYQPVRYCKTEELAVAFCKSGKTYTKNDCWAINEESPEYRYKAIESL